MTNVSVSYHSMADQARRLTAGKAQIEQELLGLKQQVDVLVRDGFVTDSASIAFQQSYEEFTHGMRQTMEGLDGMATYLTRAAAAFQDVDSQLASALKG